MDEVFSKIENADDNQLREMVCAIIRRYKEKRPDWEFCFFSLPGRSSSEREERIQEIADFLNKEV